MYQITRGEFDLFVGPSAATYYYNCKYTYCVYGTVSLPYFQCFDIILYQSAPGKKCPCKNNNYPTTKTMFRFHPANCNVGLGLRSEF